MDVVINKRKIRDTVKQLVENGQKNIKQHNRTHSKLSDFSASSLIRNGLGFNPYMTAKTAMAVKQF